MFRPKFKVLVLSVFIVLSVFSAVNAANSPDKKLSLRFAHFTDIHMTPDNNAPQGLALALRHMQRQKPQLLVTTGDNIMDALANSEDSVKVQFGLLKKVFEAECKIPVKFGIGNHDIWGWVKDKSKTTGKEENWGKKWVVSELDMPNRYYSYDAGGWHFIMLDSMQPGTNGVYMGKLDDEQFEWLQKELQTNRDKYTVIFSHIPIFSAAVFFDGDNEKSGYWNIGNGLMHIDARKLKDLFSKYPNVKLCISGHLHLLDRVEYNGVTYICDGAVCGAWWGGNYQECPEGYGLFDLYNDGSFDYQYIDYRWNGKTRSPD